MDGAYKHIEEVLKDDTSRAGVAQLVERHLAKVNVESSSLFSRSKNNQKAPPLSVELFDFGFVGALPIQKKDGTNDKNFYTRVLRQSREFWKGAYAPLLYKTIK